MWAAIEQRAFERVFEQEKAGRLAGALCLSLLPLAQPHTSSSSSGGLCVKSESAGPPQTRRNPERKAASWAWMQVSSAHSVYSWTYSSRLAAVTGMPAPPGFSSCVRRSP